jgi:hypothetical protein
LASYYQTTKPYVSKINQKKGWNGAKTIEDGH